MSFDYSKYYLTFFLSLYNSGILDLGQNLEINSIAVH